MEGPGEKNESFCWGGVVPNYMYTNLGYCLSMISCHDVNTDVKWRRNRQEAEREEKAEEEEE